MIRKLKNDSKIINLEDYKKNKTAYMFEVNIPYKSDLRLDNPHGQGKKIEKLTRDLHLRIGELENDIIKLGSEERNLTISTFVRYLILEYGKNIVKDKMEGNYKNYLEKYKILSEELEGKKMLRENLLEKRGVDKKTANQLCYQRTKLKFEMENIRSELNHLENYFKRYEKFFE